MHKLIYFRRCSEVFKILELLKHHQENCFLNFYTISIGNQFYFLLRVPSDLFEVLIFSQNTMKDYFQISRNHPRNYAKSMLTQMWIFKKFPLEFFQKIIRNYISKILPKKKTFRFMQKIFKKIVDNFSWTIARHLDLAYFLSA